MQPRPAGKPEVFAVVLAAGESVRFGGSKLLEILDGEPLVARAARIANAACGDHCLLVTGHRSSDVRAAAGGWCTMTLENPDYRSGLGTSIALAARTLAGRARALLLLLADQPLIETGHLERLLSAWEGDRRRIVATHFDGRTGPPVLMPESAIPALAQLSGDRGAHELLQDPRFDLRTVVFEPAAFDIDTPQDLAILRRRLD